MGNIIEVRDVSCSFNGETVIGDISMGIPRGGLVAITGTSGSGKSTLLKIMAGLIVPDSGTVEVDGELIGSVSRNTLFLMRRKMSFVFQDAALLSNLNVYNNIALPLRYHFGMDEKLIENKVYGFLQTFDLMRVRNTLPAHLSMGLRKLAGFARALVVEPKIIFFDEPITGIDAIARRKVIERLLPLKRDPEVTIVTVSHNLDFIKSYADRIALVHEQRLFAYGTREETLSSTDPVLQTVLSTIVDEESAEADEVLGLLTGEF